MISLSKLPHKAKECGVSMTSLKTKGIISGQSHTNLINMIKGVMSTDGITLGTINAICRYLNCQPGDIMEYVEDEPEAE